MGITLDEAILHAEEVAEELKWKSKPNRKYPCFDSEEKRKECQECGEEHEQLAEWLKDYKRLKEQEKTETVSIEAFEQIKWERDIAIQQLNELGYGLGEKIRTDDDAIRRQAVLDLAEKGVLVSNGNYKSICKAINELPSVKPKADVGALINKIETEFSSSMYDDWGNITALHDGLVDTIKEWAESEG